MRIIDSLTIEIDTTQGETLTEVIIALARLDIVARSMRNKANRLEELFVRLTHKEE